MGKKSGINRLTALKTCMECEISSKICDDNCATQYEAGNMGEIVKTLNMAITALSADGDLISRKEALSKAFEIKTGEYTSAMVIYAQSIRMLPTIPQTAIKHNGEMECPNCGLKFYEIPTIETVLEEIKAEIQGLIDFEESCCGNTTLGYQCLGIIKDRISELKGESEE